MKKKILIAAMVCTIIASTLSGCSMRTNMARKFKKNLDYTFDGDYTVVKDNGGWSNADGWKVTFTDKNGREQTQFMYSYDWSDQKEYYDSKKDYVAGNYYYFLDEMRADIARDEFFEDIVSKYIDYDPDLDSHADEDVNIHVLICDYGDSSYKKYAEHAYEMIDPKSGLKLTETDLKSTAQDDHVTIGVYLNVNNTNEHTVDEYLEAFKSILADFEEYTETPQNYIFHFRDRTDGQRNNTIFRKDVFQGEFYDYAAAQAELEGEDEKAPNVMKKVMEKFYYE